MTFAHAIARLFLFSVVSALLLASCGGGSGGGNQPANSQPGGTWLIDASSVIDGGPGRDGIPSIDNPQFEPIAINTDVADDDLVIAVRSGSEVRAYPHDVMDWHEITNDAGGAAGNAFVVSYCPLTGSAFAWDVDDTLSNPTFGVSGRLFNSNLILYDRETESLWVQMMEIAVNGVRIGEQADRLQIIETTKSTLRDMYPNASILTRNTGFTRQYGVYPYGSYRDNAGLLFPVQNTDSRLHPKARVLGIRQGDQVKVYQLRGFGDTTQIINDQVGGQSVVIVGNSKLNFAAAFNRQLADGTILNFSALQDGNTSIVLQDDEGTVWDVWGSAVSGPRAGEQLSMTTSTIAYWFAWVAFYPQAEIYFN